MLSSFKKSPVEQETIGCYSIFQVGSLSYCLERKTQPEIATEIGHTKSYVSKRLDKTEKGEMAETIDRYLAWKYSVPGGKDCFWAGEQEKLYMREQDARHLIFHLPKMPDMSWMKSLRRMGF